MFVLRGIGSYVSDYGMAYTGFRVVYDLRRALVDKLLKLPTPYYDVTPGGVVQSKLTFDAHQLASAASNTITVAIRSTMTILASFGLLMYFNWRLTLWTFVILPVVAVVIRYFSRRLRRIARDVQTRTAALTHVLVEMIGGHRIVRIFGGEAYERERAVGAANALRNSMSKQSSASAASSPITQILAVLAVAVIIWIALGQSEDGQARPADLPRLHGGPAHAARTAEGARPASTRRSSADWPRRSPSSRCSTSRTSRTTAPSGSSARAASCASTASRSSTRAANATR